MNAGNPYETRGREEAAVLPSGGGQSSRGAGRRFVEILGHYYPRTNPAKLEVDRERVNYWLSKGARPSDTVRTLLARQPAPAAPVVAE